MIDEPVWLERADVLQLHDEQIRLYGGKSGIRDMGALDSALARPRNLNAYQTPDIFELAASYAFGLVRNHCFIDGNKRTAFVSSAVFLLDHNFLIVPDPAHVSLFNALAAGEVTEETLTTWFKSAAIEFKI